MFCRKDDTGYRHLAEGFRLKTLVYGKNTHLCELRLVKGSKVPNHSHPHEQSGYMVSGRIRFILRDEIFEAGPGDGWCFPGGVEHAPEALEDVIMVEVFSPVRQDYL
jgi:quercetin dioxygenase-like cupin family protein